MAIRTGESYPIGVRNYAEDFIQRSNAFQCLVNGIVKHQAHSPKIQYLRACYIGSYG